VSTNPNSEIKIDSNFKNSSSSFSNACSALDNSSEFPAGSFPPRVLVAAVEGGFWWGGAWCSRSLLWCTAATESSEDFSNSTLYKISQIDMRKKEKQKWIKKITKSSRSRNFSMMDSSRWTGFTKFLGISNICKVPTSSPTANNCKRVFTEASNSKEVILAWAAFNSIEGWKEESVKSHTRMFPSAQAVNSTAGRVVDQHPAVK